MTVPRKRRDYQKRMRLLQILNRQDQFVEMSEPDNQAWLEETYGPMLDAITDAITIPIRDGMEERMKRQKAARQKREQELRDPKDLNETLYALRKDAILKGNEERRALQAYEERYGEKGADYRDHLINQCFYSGVHNGIRYAMEAIGLPFDHARFNAELIAEGKDPNDV
jgi:hypothetical protein